MPQYMQSESLLCVVKPKGLGRLWSKLGATDAALPVCLGMLSHDMVQLYPVVVTKMF